jgi:hypothetical protein
MSRLALPVSVLAAVALTAAACSDSTSPASVSLSAVNPAPDAVAVSTATTVTLTFDHRMQDGMEQYVDMHQGGITGAVVPMNCGWNAGQTTLTCTPMGPLAAGAPYMIHVGCGMTDAQGHMMDMDNWTTRGGEWATSGMMGGNHAGQPIGMMGAGWMHGSHYGMMFTFTTV